MKTIKVLLTSDHVETHPDRTYGPYSVSSDLETFPFIDSGYALMLLPAGDLRKEQIDAIVASIDIVVFSGGRDVDPLLYQEEVQYGNVQRYTIRDAVEMRLLESAIQHKKPVFGICRGEQLINVYFKGSLFQNIAEQKHARLRHMQDPVDKLTHKVTIQKNSFLYDIYNQEETWVNSYHNQSIKELGDGLRAVAYSTDGIIEAIQHETLPIWAVQWHPEVSYHFDVHSKMLIQAITRLGT